MASESTSAMLDMQRIIALNEHIKEVLKISSASYLVAINSMLIAKSSGRGLLGFGVVSTELRLFSRKLDEAMAQFGGLTLEMVRKAAQYKKLSREHGLLLATQAKTNDSGHLLDASLRRKQQTLQILSAAFERDRHTLSVQSKRAMLLCKSGEALARSAKIEAAYGGEMGQVLAEIAEDIESTIIRIVAIINALKAELES